VLRLTLLAPEIVEAIVNGRQPAGLEVNALMMRFPVGWAEQRMKFSDRSRCKLTAFGKGGLGLSDRSMPEEPGT
jgi:hypothetical protein